MWARLKSFATMIFRRSLWERDLREELEFHIEERAAALERTGLARQDAVRVARTEFRRIETTKEECREARGSRWIDEISRNLTCAARSIRQHPVFATVAVLSLALGIGANVAVFGVLHRMVLSTLPVRDPGALYHIVIQQPGRTAYEIPFPKFAMIRDNFDQFTLFGWGGFKRPVTIGESHDSLYVIYVTGNYFETLGVLPAAGRLFEPRDEKEAIADVAVISHALWRSVFGGEASVLERKIDIGGKIYRIAGVAPAGFAGFEPGNPVDVYLTLHGGERLQPNVIKGAGLNWIHPVARLKPGVAIAEARAVVRDRWSALDEAYRRPFMRNGHDIMLLERAGNGFSAAGQQFTPALIVLMGLVAAVFLIACANVATLLFVRGADRIREMSIRLALGASRAQLIRQWLTECMLLAAGGGVAGIIAARWITNSLLLFVSEADRAWLRFDPNETTVFVTLGLTFAAGLACGLLPAVKVTATAPEAALRMQGAAAARRGTVAQLVLAAQLAASLVLIVGGTMFARTLWNLNNADLGFDRRSVVYAMPQFATMPRDQRAAAVETVVTRLRQSPLVEAASMGDAPMLWAGSGWNFVFDVPGYTLSEGEDNTTWGNNVAAGYFETVGMRLVAGRNFAESDRPKNNELARVIIINERMARHYFAGRDPIGQFIKLYRADGPAVQIIGVVTDARSATLRTQRDEYFRPSSVGGWSIVVARPKPGVSADTLMGLMRTAFAEFAKDENVEIAPLEAAVQKTIGRDRLIARLSAAFAALGIVLAIIGLYAAIAHSVTSRTREIGIRIAIGAARRDVMWMVLKQGIAVTALGVTIGLPFAILGSSFIETLLFEVSPTDPVSLGAATALLAVTGIAAGLWPARRAAKLDPSQALRFE
jgi:predicted permease